MSTKQPSSIEELSINVIRGLAIDAVERAKSGHPGLPMGVATIGYSLWMRHMRHNPADPSWPDRDRFVLSAGHGSMLLYALLHLTGYDLPLEELRRFRQWGSRTPGHPEHGLTPGVETTTGPLGQGFGNAVGMALAERWQAATYNRGGHEIVNHHTYVLASDGDLMEGVQSESASLAGHWGLNRLVVIYDANRISIDGSTDLAFTEDVTKRYEGYGWHVQHVDGHDLSAVDGAIEKAKAENARPNLIVARTHIGYGSPHKQDSAEAHGSPLGAAEAKLAKERLGLPADREFWVPDEVRAHMAGTREKGRADQEAWQIRARAHETAHPELARQYRSALASDLPDGLWDALPAFKPGDKVATRQASGATLNAVATQLPWLIGGSADLTESNSTLIQGARPIQKGQYGERYIHFGVREHGMGAILNGLTLHGGIRCFGGTFLIFSDYMRPTIRLAALMEQPVIYVFTHDSIGLGEDGPTHQPVEQLMSLRLIPNLEVIRPADAAETAVAWRMALERKHGPTALVLTRQKLPVLERRGGAHASPAHAMRGGYVLAEARADGQPVPPQVILIASGSEVHICLDARSQLAAAGIAARVVSMPSLTRFLAEPPSYQEEVLPPEVVERVAVEAGATLGWAEVVGPLGEVVGLNRFGASAPGEVAMRELGFSAENVAERAREAMARSNRTAFSSFSRA